jgi:3-isopropylmalate dehydrogenase
MSRLRIVALGGDGIGPEVTAVALEALACCLPIEVTPALIGGAAIDATGEALPAATVELCRRADAVFLGAVGGPRWSGPVRPEQGLLGLRQALGVDSNLRPARDLGLPTPLRPELVAGADILVVRDLLGGVYFGTPREEGEVEAVDTWRQTAAQTRKVARRAFALARERRRRVTSVDKANVLAASRLWRREVIAVAAEFPDVALDHLYVDAAAFALLAAPRRFDVVLADNLFGDILSDELAAVAGSIGVLPSASLGDGPALYEPVHGSAPEIAGRGIANPTGALLSAALLLEHTARRPDLAAALERAVVETLVTVRTPDLGGNATTIAMAAAVFDRLERYLAEETP